MHDWVHLEWPRRRLRFTLDRLCNNVLREGLKYLRHLVCKTVARGIGMESEWGESTALEDATQHGFAYVRWLWHPRPGIFVDILDKDALLAFLMVDISTYDAILCS